MKIQFYRRNVYGVERMYVEGPLRDTISALTGTKVLLPTQKARLAELGHTFEEVMAPKKD